MPIKCLPFLISHLIKEATLKDDDNDDKKSIQSIKNKQTNVIITQGDFILVESKLQLRRDHLEAAEAATAADSNVYHELINESSNTNYSVEENEDNEGKQQTSTADLDMEYFAQVKTIWNDSINNNGTTTIT
jgi:hypothetical protein